MRKAVVRPNGFVENVIEIEDDANWSPPDGCYLINALDSGSPGDTWDGTKFITPAPIITKPTRDLAAELDALKAWAKTKGYVEKPVEIT
jgi:hypothetical protein